MIVRLVMPPKVVSAPIQLGKLVEMCYNEGKYTVLPVCGCPQQHKLPVFWPLQP